MVQAITSVSLSTGGTYLNGLASNSTLTLRGVGMPGDTFEIVDERNGQFVFPYYTSTVSASGTWSAGGTQATYLFGIGGPYRYHFLDVSTGLVSPTVSLTFGAPGSETLVGPTLGATSPTPTYLFGQLGPTPRIKTTIHDGNQTFFAFNPGPAGNDTFIAYVAPQDTSAPHEAKEDISIIGGTGTGDTAVIPTTLSGVTAHSRGAYSAGESSHLTVETADATVRLTHVEHLQFNDVRLTVQDDPLMDFLYYDTRYSDIAAADLNVRAHYDAYGWHEGRDPNALFSTQGYLGAYADVRGAGDNPLSHYEASGWKEGRDPSAAFDTKLYLLFNPDVAKSGMNPLAHYLNFGAEEGRKSSPVIESTLVNDGFDPLYYKLANADVGLAGMDARAHYDQFGWKEGRNPDAFFDTNAYLAHNADVKAAGIDPLAHYETFGWKEGRDPSTHFNTSAYLAANLDVAAAGLSPLQHFLQFGAAEGRSGFGDLY